MTKTDFEQKVAQILEVDHVDAETAFRDLPGWCSLQAFGLLVMMENDCGTRMDTEAFRKLVTVGDLYRAVAQ